MFDGPIPYFRERGRSEFFRRVLSQEFESPPYLVARPIQVQPRRP